MKRGLPTTVAQAIGKQLKKHRRLQNKSQEEVAFSVGIEPSYYSRIEGGAVNFTIAILYSLVKNLHLKSSDVLKF